MKARWLVFALCVAAPAFAQERATDNALQVLDNCRARLDPRVDVGIDRIRRRCPDLLPALDKAPWRGLLPSTLGKRHEEISAQSLRALSELVRHAGDATPQRAAPSRALLDPVLAGLGEQGRQGATRWERFKRWLREKFEDRPDDNEPGWLEKWSRKIHTSEGVAQALTYAGYAMVVALALYVILQELRAAGLWRGSRTARRDSPAAEWRRRLMLADVLAAPLAERPGMLLRLLGEALARAQRLPAAEGLTAGAIARRARLDDDADRAALAQVARTAEELRYAPQAPAEASIEAAVAEARGLLARIVR